MSGVRRVGVCGAGGTMGAGIAIVSARAGFETRCFDLSRTSLRESLRESKAFFEKSVVRGKLAAEARDQALSRLVAAPALADLAGCDLVVEAVFEDLATKRALFGELEEVCGEETLFASNTSTLSSTELASGLARPERVVGLHFCL
ncbi:MAG: 3-hydroxyacyl-CoA dehydrogenase NAD-binding domain-containing protein, partial [Myxococcota bacterium]